MNPHTTDSDALVPGSLRTCFRVVFPGLARAPHRHPALALGVAQRGSIDQPSPMAASVADQRGQRHACVAAAGGRGDDAGGAHLAEHFDGLAGRRDAGLDVVGRGGDQPLLRRGQSADNGAVLVVGGPGWERDGVTVAITDDEQAASPLATRPVPPP